MEKFNRNWLFSEGEREGADQRQFDDNSWRGLNLPHDWSVEYPFDKQWDGCTGYLPGGTGWYRKHFTLSQDTPVETVYLCFDGVYHNADFYINGIPLGTHNYGYSPFRFEISQYLSEGDNVLSVKVDHTRYADSRWYTGGGIYRSVKLICLDSLHIPPHGTFITTKRIDKNAFEVCSQVTLENRGEKKEALTLEMTLRSPSHKQIPGPVEEIVLSPGETRVIEETMVLENPELWDIQSPELYQCFHRIRREGEIIQSYTTVFGVRTIFFDPEKGFFLNGKNRKIKGVCLHHDGGLTGAAVPDDVWKRRLLKLKEGGCNAIRTAHNPPSEDFLDLCDQLGLLVQEEFYDEWDTPKDKQHNKGEIKAQYITQSLLTPFKSWAEEELKAAMRRDRNHPSIIQWSIGNEIEWCFPDCQNVTGYFDAQATGNYFWTTPPYGKEEIRKRVENRPKTEFDIGETAALLARWTREMDQTRPITANCILPSASYENGYANALDVVGYSYRQVIYDYGHEHYGDKPLMGTENLGQWHEWKAVEEREFVSGLFLWTGIDYMGESHGKWPKKGTSSGLLDLAGFEKPAWHMYKTLWNEEPHVHLETIPLKDSLYQLNAEGELEEKIKDGWKQRLWFWHSVNRHWNYEKDEPVVVEVYTNQSRAELFLNGKSLGIKRLSDQKDHILKWLVPFEEGELTVKGRGEKKETSHDISPGDTLITSSLPTGIYMNADRSTLPSDGESVVHITVQLTDGENHPVRVVEREVFFTLTGPGRILGVDNGACDSIQSYQADRVITCHGQCLLAVQVSDSPGFLHIEAASLNLSSSELDIEIK